MSGSGTLESPWDLATALNSAEVNNLDIPNKTLHLRFGTYSGSYISTLLGTVSNPITVKPYNNEVVKIDGKVTVNGGSVVFQDIEFYYSGWEKRDTLESGSDPSDIPDDVTLSINSPGSKFINCIIHDLSGPGFWALAIGSELYGCVIYNIGWSGPDRGHGHGIYVQNKAGETTVKTVRDCIIFNTFGYGIHAYTEGGSIDYITLDGNTVFDCGILHAGAKYNAILMGGYNVIIQYPTVIGNKTYNSGIVNIGYVDDAEHGFNHLILNDNYFPDGWGGYGGTRVVDEIDGNTLGTIGNVALVELNDYISTRAHVTIYNEDGADSATVDLTTVTGLSIGDTVTAWNVQAGIGNDVQTLTLDADKCITVDMQAASRSVAAPIGWTAPATTFPTFGCFVVEKA